MLILYIFFGLIVLIQVVYYGYIFNKFSYKNPSTKSLRTPPVSVVIACRNEAKNLAKNLPCILNQAYPQFEIILIDDASTDTTWSVMQNFKQQYHFIKTIQIPTKAGYSGNKKNALRTGISFASFEYLIFTDADCKPNTKNWIGSLATKFDAEKKIVLGYGPYLKEQTFLNKLIRYETLLTAWQYFSYSLIGMPYMGVGRNMGYTKKTFTQAKGFDKHRKIISGDDDLFINQVATFQNVALCWSKDSFVYSDPKKKFSDWINQKRRHIATATHYHWYHQLLLGLFYVSQLLFFVLFFILLWQGFKVKSVLLLFGIRYFFYFLNLIPAAGKLDEKDLILIAPFLELYLIVIQLRIFIANLWQKPSTW